VRCLKLLGYFIIIEIGFAIMWFWRQKVQSHCTKYNVLVYGNLFLMNETTHPSDIWMMK